MSTYGLHFLKLVSISLHLLNGHLCRAREEKDTYGTHVPTYTSVKKEYCFNNHIPLGSGFV